MKQYGDRRVFPVRGVVAAVWRRFQNLPSFWVEGEITNLSAPRGTQVFFTLVDTDHSDPTQIDCLMQANVFSRIAAPPAEGQLVQAYGRIEFWRGRSALRLRVERLEPSGEGLLLARIAELRAALRAEGLADPDRKRPVPFLPRRIGLVTAREGAARADVLTTVTRRFPAADMLVVTCLVQGEGAPEQIAGALRFLDAQPDVDVIILARGGGALEDLMAFNSEIVCRAVAAAATPVVSAIGHETDVTLSDEVADVRASTPTAAGELVVPDSAELNRRLDLADTRARSALRRIATRDVNLLDERARRLRAGLEGCGTRARHRVDLAGVRLAPAMGRLARDFGRTVLRSADRLAPSLRESVARGERRMDQAGAMLEVLSPQRTVERGYAIVRNTTGRVIGHIGDISRGDRLALQLSDGIADVEAIEIRSREAE